MTTTNHAETIKTLLEGAGYSGTIYKGPLASHTDDRAVFIWPNGSAGPPSFTFASDEAEYNSRYRLRCRGPEQDYDQAEQDSRLIKDALTEEQPNGYLGIRMSQGPSYIQTDDQDRHEFTFTIRCWLIE